MRYISCFIQEIAAIFLFFYSIERFSRLILHRNLTEIKNFFSKVADTNSKALLSGLLATIIIQSSTAVSTLAVTLTNAGVLSIKNAMPIIFGSSIGTSSTGLIVSLKMKSVEEVLIVIGSILKMTTKHRATGKVVFYLGLLLLSIEQMSLATAGLKDSPLFKYLFSAIDNTAILYITGIILTIILQSSSLMTSILILLISQNGIKIDNAVIIAIGAVVGTTLTALIVSLKMSQNAKVVAIFNCIISFIASIINLFFIDLFVKLTLLFKDEAFGFAITNSFARTISALLCMAIFISINRFTNLVSKYKND
jgi:phosphate:Na+ symporter